MTKAEERRRQQARLGLAALAVALLAGLHLAASLGNPVGLIEDDSVQILLAKSLRHGAFALPDANGVPVTDPLPGMALILSLPVWSLDPDWHPLRAVALLSLAAAVFFTWRIGRRLLPGPWPAVAACMTAVSPVMLRHAGLVLPDITYLALTLAALDLGTSPGPYPRAVVAALAAALAALVRPHGAFLILCLAVALGSTHDSPGPEPSVAGRRVPLQHAGRDGPVQYIGKGRVRGLGATLNRGPLFLAALIPLGLWLVRNSFLAGVSTGYAVNWRAQMALLGDPANQGWHALGIISSFFGQGMAGLSGIWRFMPGMLILILAGLGAGRLLRRRTDEQPLVFAMSAYLILVLALHLTWSPEDSRYVIPLVPIVWLFVCASRPLGARAGRVLMAVFLLTCLWRDARIAALSMRRSYAYQPRTMEWIRQHTGPGARLQALKYNTVMLLTGRPALPPPLYLRDRIDWTLAAAADDIDYLHVERVFRPGGFIPAGVPWLGVHLAGWAKESPGVRLAYRNMEEGSAVFDLRGALKPLGRTPGKPDRFRRTSSRPRNP